MRARLVVVATLGVPAACAMPEFAIGDARQPSDAAVEGAVADAAGDTSATEDAPSYPDVTTPTDAAFDGNVAAFVATVCASGGAGSTNRGIVVDGRVHCYFRNVANGPWANAACQPPT